MRTLNAVNKPYNFYLMRIFTIKKKYGNEKFKILF